MINSFSLFDFDIHNVYTNNIKNSVHESSHAEQEKKNMDLIDQNTKRKLYLIYYINFGKKIDSLWKRLAILSDKIIIIEFADDGWIFDCKLRLSRACFQFVIYYHCALYLSILF